MIQTDLPTIAERTSEHALGEGRLYVLPTPVRDVVSFRGSFRTYPDFAAGEDMLQALTVAMLDKGTRRRDRFAVADALERRGARLTFENAGLHVRFSGRALRDDLPDVLDLIAEQLREPLFDDAEFEKARSQVAAGRQRALESTASQAAGALARRLYEPAHPNYSPRPEEELEQLAGFAADDVRAYHARQFGARDLALVLVGDVAGETVAPVAQRAFEGWVVSVAAPQVVRAATPQPPGRADVPMPDKSNADVRIGQALHLRRDDDAYLPLYLATYILGGNFSARLMTVIRDEMGLTYGIGARLVGVTTDHEGHWRVAVTLSQDNIERGIEATQGEIRRFIEEGVTDAELAEKKTTITGGFLVGLATTGGLATSMLTNIERGFGVRYLDQYPDRINAVTLDQANAAIRRHLDPDALHVAVAGHLAEHA